MYFPTSQLLDFPIPENIQSWPSSYHWDPPRLHHHHHSRSSGFFSVQSESREMLTFPRESVWGRDGEDCLFLLSAQLTDMCWVTVLREKHTPEGKGRQMHLHATAVTHVSLSQSCLLYKRVSALLPVAALKNTYSGARRKRCFDQT